MDTNITSDQKEPLGTTHSYSIHDLPADIWANISSRACQGLSLSKRLLDFSSSLAAANKAILTVIINNFDPFLIATRQATDADKITMLFGTLNEKKYKLFCKLLKHNTHLLN